MMDKMRIIYTPDSSPVAEYIKTFFDFVGLLVYDKLIISDADIRSINKPSGPNSIDIVINMYGLPVYPELGLNQVYLYVDLEHKAFMLGDKPLKSIEDLKRMIYEKSDKVIFFGSKRDTRIKILDSLIDKISENNSESLRILKEIRELYVPTNEDKDMFYVLQTVNMIDMVFNSKILTGGIPLPRNTSSLDASFAINELTKMYVDLSLIKDNLFNPYLKSSIVSVLESLSAYAGSKSIDKSAEYLTRKTVFF